jgi:hypothetical protein
MEVRRKEGGDAELSDSDLRDRTTSMADPPPAILRQRLQVLGEEK